MGTVLLSEHSRLEARVPHPTRITLWRTSVRLVVLVHLRLRYTHTSPMQVLNWTSTGSDLIPVSWPRIANGADTMTYDLIRMTTPIGITNPSLAYPYPGAVPVARVARADQLPRAWRSVMVWSAPTQTADRQQLRPTPSTRVFTGEQ